MGLFNMALIQIGFVLIFAFVGAVCDREGNWQFAVTDRSYKFSKSH
jgi:hypothetical protein